MMFTVFFTFVYDSIWTPIVGNFTYAESMRVIRDCQEIDKRSGYDCIYIIIPTKFFL